MTASIFVTATDTTFDLPRPDTTATPPSIGLALPKPDHSVTDAGRISFGAGCRILRSK